MMFAGYIPVVEACLVVGAACPVVGEQTQHSSSMLRAAKKESLDD